MPRAVHVAPPLPGLDRSISEVSHASGAPGKVLRA